MLDKYTINLLERLVIAEENKVKELKEINKKLEKLNVYAHCSGEMYVGG